MKDEHVLDSEIYKNYLLIGFKNIMSGKVSSVESYAANTPLPMEDRRWLKQYMAKRRTIGFNSAGFDLLIIYGAIDGMTPAELKRMADDIIVGGMKSWEARDYYNIPIPRDLDHIDLMEVAPGKASLKIYNGRMHGRRMQDLPIKPEKVLTDQEMEDTYEYWKNDLEATELLRKELSVQLDLRSELGKIYGIDLRSKSDAQLAEAVIRKQIEKLKGEKVQKPKINVSESFRYKSPSYIRFRNKEMQHILRRVNEHDFRISQGGKLLMPEFLAEAKVTIGSSTYTMGVGGLHSTEKCRRVVAGATHKLFDVDVESYYPRIILNLGLYPKHLGKAFLKVYKSIVDRRIAAKENDKRLKKEIQELTERILQSNGNTELMRERLAELEIEWRKENVANEGGKIMINGSFGKLGSPYSILCSFDLLLTVTLTGQLSLLMLIEWLTDEGIDVVSGNTDGIVIRPRNDQVELMREIVKDWEHETQFKTEETPYSAIYSASVNAYFAVKLNEKGEVSGVKRKGGTYAVSGLNNKINPSNDIVADAVALYLEKGTPVTETIRACRDIRKFVTVRTVAGGAIYGVREVEFERRGKRGQLLKPGTKYDTSDAYYLGKAVRFYRSTESIGALHYQGSNNKVPDSDGCVPYMEMTDEFPKDVDFAAYVREARKVLHDIGYYDDTLGDGKKKKAAA